MNYRSIFCALVAITVTASAYAQEREAAIVNSLRLNGCPQHGKQQALLVKRQLNVAAQLLNDGIALREALRRSGYRADQSADIRATGISDQNALRAMLIRNYCKTISDANLTEVGVARRGNDLAIVFAAPFAPPPIGDTAEIELEVLKLVNAARAQSRRCGTKTFAATAPLTLNDKLHRAALGHAKDMAKRGEVVHEGADGSTPDERATRAGYVWKAVGENVAGGHLSAKEVVDGWLTSPHHCENIMDKDFTQMAVAFAVNPKQKIGIYWAQEFGRPR